MPFEDQIFILRAYVHARSIAILADRACYYYVRRIGSGGNAGDRRMEPATHCNALARGARHHRRRRCGSDVRDRLYRRFYRTTILSPIVGAAMIDYEPSFRAELMREFRTLVDARFAPSVHDGCGAANRISGRLFLDDDADGLVALSETYRRISLRVEHAPRRPGTGVRCPSSSTASCAWTTSRCAATAWRTAGPFRAAWAPTVEVADRVLDDARNNIDLELSVVARVDPRRRTRSWTGSRWASPTTGASASMGRAV